MVSDDAPQAFQAVGTLSHAPRQSVPFLRDRVQAVAAPAAERLKQLVAALESNQFVVREKASVDLQDLGELAAPALRAVLEGKPALETHRQVEALLEKVEKQATWSGERILPTRRPECSSEIRRSSLFLQVQHLLPRSAPEPSAN